MRKLFLFAPLAIFLGLGFFLWKGLYLDPRALPSALLDKPMPAFELQSLHGEKQLTVADLKGDVALVNVWATWCPTCKEEHQVLNQIAQEGVTIFGINYKDERPKALDWLQKYLNPYKAVIFDPDGRLGLDLGVYGAPETYIIDANGVIKFRHVGAVDQQVWQKLKAIMEQVKGGKA
ncbi:MAG: hypothetical protein RL143_258 [Pseudomonadota bacterium]